MKPLGLLRAGRTAFALLHPTICMFLFSCSTLGNPIYIELSLRPASATPYNSSATLFVTPLITPPVVQTSKSLISNNPREQYLLIKRTLSKPGYLASIEIEDNTFDLGTCFTVFDPLDLPDDDPTEGLYVLAIFVIRLRTALTEFGYPKSVWAPMLIQFEKEQLAILSSKRGYRANVDAASSHLFAFDGKMVRKLNNYRKRKARHLPEADGVDGCGAGDLAINVSTDPADGRVIFIPVFFYELCEAQQIDPNDLAKCNRWRTPVDGMLFEVLGDYYYRASWPGGVVDRGRLRFTHNPSEAVPTVIFRKPSR
jgi:hypothetical protein